MRCLVFSHLSLTQVSFLKQGMLKPCVFFSGLSVSLFALIFSLISVQAIASENAKYAGKAILGGMSNANFPDMSRGSGTRRSKLGKVSAICASCHEESSPGVYSQWTHSEHYSANIGCYECHKAEPTDADAIRHKDYIISVIVSPKDCANCHKNEVAEFERSHHAKAYDTQGSPDALLADVVQASKTMKIPGHNPAKVSGCDQCHGSDIKVLDSGELDPLTWPNSGIGRLNPDGSKGACSACHARHEFSSAQARHPDTCGKCHQGEKNPIKKIYEESKHGIAFESDIEGMHLDRGSWIVGQDYTVAPTCSTCHMSATNDLAITHDTGSRISWNNRGPISVRPEQVDEVMGLEESSETDWEERRDNMLSVCSSCHTEEFISNFFIQYDALINLYNNKFGEPGSELMTVLEPLLKPQEFANKIDWIWFELYHNEGRAARHGASMMAPDITHWEGTYEVAKSFYQKFLPEVKRIIAKGRKNGKTEQADAAQAVLDKILANSDHRWLNPAPKAPSKAIDLNVQTSDANSDSLERAAKQSTSESSGGENSESSDRQSSDSQEATRSSDRQSSDSQDTTNEARQENAEESADSLKTESSDSLKANKPQSLSQVQELQS